MGSEYYVILTGGKNNAGDFLIGYRGRQLLSHLRRDRNVVELDGWKKFSDEDLELVNKAKALIMLGGPAIQYNMFPKVYGLTENLDDIRVPIITLGVGHKDFSGKWERTKNYQLSAQSTALLNKIHESGYSSSVRDYLTLNVLQNKGYNKFVMTGCPALYSNEHLNKPCIETYGPKKVGFSLGVSYLESERMLKQMQSVISQLADYYANDEFSVAYHHSYNPDNAKQMRFYDWLSGKGIRVCDISGSVESLIDYYSKCDLHIGYRVHAHIYMVSVNKPSIIINEDSRGRGVQDVVNCWGFDAFDEKKLSFLDRALIKAGKRVDCYLPVRDLGSQILKILDYERQVGFSRVAVVRANIDSHYGTMKRFISQLP